MSGHFPIPTDTSRGSAPCRSVGRYSGGGRTAVSARQWSCAILSPPPPPIRLRRALCALGQSRLQEAQRRRRRRRVAPLGRQLPPAAQARLAHQLQRVQPLQQLLQDVWEHTVGRRQRPGDSRRRAGEESRG